MKIKERRRHFSCFRKRWVWNWMNERARLRKLHWVCLRARVLTVCASAVCSDQTHWCVIGFPLSRWPLRLECLSWWRTGGGRIDDNVLQTPYAGIRSVLDISWYTSFGIRKNKTALEHLSFRSLQKSHHNLFNLFFSENENNSIKISFNTTQVR